MDLLLITDENNSHYDFNRFMYNKSKIRIKALLQILFTMF